MLDRVVLDRHVFFAAVVLQHAQEVGAPPEVVEVGRLRELRTLIGRKRSIALQTQKVSLDALDISVLSERPRERCERLVERVRRDSADSAAEDVGSDHLHDFGNSSRVKGAELVVGVDLEKEGVDDVGLDLVEVLEGALKLVVFLLAECHRAVAPSVLA